MIIGNCGYLGQMCNAQHLLAARKVRHLLTDALSRNTGYSGVNFIENHGLNRVIL